MGRHYEAKGYTVHRSRKVRGQTGAVYAIDMVVQAPHGNMLITFGDDGEVGGPEVGAIRNAARDIGATPVVAAPELPQSLRNQIAQAGVVVVDRAALEEEAVRAPQALDPTDTWAPWPQQGEAWPEGREHERPSNRDLDEATRSAQERRFGWLKHAPSPTAGASPGPAVDAATPPAATVQRAPDAAIGQHKVPAPVPPASSRLPDSFDWRAPVLYGTVTGLVGGAVLFLLMLLV